MKRINLILLIFISYNAHAQIGFITTYAGPGGTAYSGDDGCVATASVRNMAEIAFDHLGNFYIAENNQTIRKVATTGLVSTVAGSSYVLGFSGDGGLAPAATLR